MDPLSLSSRTSVFTESFIGKEKLLSTAILHRRLDWGSHATISFRQFFFGLISRPTMLTLPVLAFLRDKGSIPKNLCPWFESSLDESLSHWSSSWKKTFSRGTFVIYDRKGVTFEDAFFSTRFRLVLDGSFHVARSSLRRVSIPTFLKLVRLGCGII